MPRMTQTTTDELDPADPATYRFWVDEHVRFSDTDMVGHVNNLAHCAYVETARVAYGLDLLTRAQAPITAMGFVRLEVDFRAQLHYPAQVRVGARATSAGRSSFTIITGTFADERCVATARNVMVHLGADGRPAPLPEVLRAAIEDGG